MNATVKLHITNTYEDGDEVVTQPTVQVPIPVPDRETAEFEEWEWEHILSHTGTGRTDGDAWYDVEIIESTAPELVGMKFEFGY